MILHKESSLNVSFDKKCNFKVFNLNLVFEVIIFINIVILDFLLAIEL